MSPVSEIYLDNSATTRPRPEVINKIKQVLTTDYGNPSSLHNKGVIGEKYLNKARKLLASHLNVKPGEIYFTSGGTESNNLALWGITKNYYNRGRHLITSQIEHPSVYNVFKALEEEGFQVTYLKPDKRGIVNPDRLKQALTEKTILVSIMQINNELGSRQPIQELAQTTKNFDDKIFFHVDAVQAFGKMPLHLAEKNIDLLSISGHKFHGPKGVGGLYVNNNMQIKPLFQGGGQEKDIRPGTENVPGIAGLIPALKNLPRLKKNKDDKQLAELKKIFINKITDLLPQARINTPRESAPHIINLSLKGIKGEVLVHALEEEKIYISTGSACHSRRKEENRILKAIGLSPKLREGTIRVSLSHYNDKQQLEYTAEQIKEKVDYLKF